MHSTLDGVLTRHDPVVNGIVVEQYADVELKVLGAVCDVGTQPLAEVEVEVLQYVAAATSALALFAFTRVRYLSRLWNGICPGYISRLGPESKVQADYQ